MSRFGYNIKQSFVQMGRNKGMYFTTVLAITAMMLILGLFFVAFVNVNLFARSIGKDYNVIQIYIKDGANADEVKEIADLLENMEGIDRSEFVSKADALVTLKDSWGENGYLLDNLSQNPLPDSYNVNVSDKDTANELAEKATKLAGVEDVVYYRDTIEKLADLSRFIEMGSIIAMIFLIVVSVIIVANTIKLTVFNREKEIGIMKYLGATDSFVRAPFMLGGIIVGIISALAATALTHVIYSRVSSIVGEDIKRILSVNIVPAEQLAAVLLAIFLFLGVAIGAVGSMISIRRFLDK